MSVGAALSFWPCPVRAAVPCGPFCQKAAADAEARQAEHDYLSHVARSVNAVAIVHDGLTISTIGYLWTPTAGRSSCRRTRPASRTATGSGLCCGPRARAGRSWRSDTRTAATQAPGSPRPARSASRWSARPTTKSGSRSSPGDGWSSGSSPGSTGTGGWRRTSRPRSRASRLSSTPRPASSCYEGWPVDGPIRNGL